MSTGCKNILCSLIFIGLLIYPISHAHTADKEIPKAGQPLISPDEMMVHLEEVLASERNEHADLKKQLKALEADQAALRSEIEIYNFQNTVQDQLLLATQPQIEDLEDAIGEAKGGMNGKESDDPKWSKNAKGKGRGAGEREREADKTGKYKSRVKGKLQKGQTVVTGDADGNNITGRSTSEVREIVRQSINEKTDPLENQVLPKSQREHAKEYFEKLRGN